MVGWMSLWISKLTWLTEQCVPGESTSLYTESEIRKSHNKVCLFGSTLTIDDVDLSNQVSVLFANSCSQSGDKRGSGSIYRFSTYATAARAIYLTIFLYILIIIGVWINLNNNRTIALSFLTLAKKFTNGWLNTSSHHYIPSRNYLGNIHVGGAWSYWGLLPPGSYATAFACWWWSISENYTVCHFVVIHDMTNYVNKMFISIKWHNLSH